MTALRPSRFAGRRCGSLFDNIPLEDGLRLRLPVAIGSCRPYRGWMSFGDGIPRLASAFANFGATGLGLISCGPPALRLVVNGVEIRGIGVNRTKSDPPSPRLRWAGPPTPKASTAVRDIRLWWTSRRAGPLRQARGRPDVLLRLDVPRPASGSSVASPHRK
jgi:hypothetical protein